MAGIFETLEIGKKALLAQQAGLQVTGSNIANVNTPGFSRRQIVLEPSTVLSPYPRQKGTGVEVMEIRRIYDRFLSSQIVREKAVLGKLEEESSIFRQIETFFNELEGSGLSQPLQEFFTSLQDLANNPSGRPERIALLQKAEKLVSSFRRLSNNLDQIQKDVNDSIPEPIKEINNILSQIAEINRNIGKIETSGEEAVDLKDQRGQLLEKLSESLDVSFFEKEDGQVTILLAGRSLVDGTTLWQLKTVKNPSNSNFYSIQMEDNSIDVTSLISQGKLKGLFDLRDVVLPDYISRLDKLAYTIVDKFNTQHKIGYGLDGSTGNNFFAPLSTENGAASQIALDSTITGNPDKIAAAQSLSLGDNRNALALADLQNQSLVEGTTPQSFLNSLVADLGIKASDVYTRLDQQQTIVAQLSTQRESISGVSLDEEMANLIKFESAFKGAARLISLVDEMLETVINM